MDKIFLVKFKCYTARGDQPWAFQVVDVVGSVFWGSYFACDVAKVLIKLTISSGGMRNLADTL